MNTCTPRPVAEANMKKLQETPDTVQYALDIILGGGKRPKQTTLPITQLG